MGCWPFLTSDLPQCFQTCLAAQRFTAGPSGSVLSWMRSIPLGREGHLGRAHVKLMEGMVHMKSFALSFSVTVQRLQMFWHYLLNLCLKALGILFFYTYASVRAQTKAQLSVYAYTAFDACAILSILLRYNTQKYICIHSCQSCTNEGTF